MRYTLWIGCAPSGSVRKLVPVGYNHSLESES